MWQLSETGPAIWQTTQQHLVLTEKDIGMKRSSLIPLPSWGETVAYLPWYLESVSKAESVLCHYLLASYGHIIHDVFLSSNWGLPQHLLRDASNSLPRRYNESPFDVILLIKRFVSDRELSQPPLIVWPGDTAQESYECLCKIARNEVNSH